MTTLFLSCIECNEWAPFGHHFSSLNMSSCSPYYIIVSTSVIVARKQYNWMFNFLPSSTIENSAIAWLRRLLLPSVTSCNFKLRRLLGRPVILRLNNTPNVSVWNFRLGCLDSSDIDWLKYPNDAWTFLINFAVNEIKDRDFLGLIVIWIFFCLEFFVSLLAAMNITDPVCVILWLGVRSPLTN